MVVKCQIRLPLKYSKIVCVCFVYWTRCTLIHTQVKCAIVYSSRHRLVFRDRNDCYRISCVAPSGFIIHICTTVCTLSLTIQYALMMVTGVAETCWLRIITWLTECNSDTTHKLTILKLLLRWGQGPPRTGEPMMMMMMMTILELKTIITKTDHNGM